MPRDYIFATMPQFPWYKNPRKGAINMVFGEIYMDLYQQSAKAGHAFTCRFTRSMFSREENDVIDGWLPSQHQPSPRCLGDFLKLMGHRVPEISNGNAQHVHLTTVVQTTEFSCYPGPNSVLSVLEGSMNLFQQQWQESHRGGEISKFGNFPNSSWTVDLIDAMKCGWKCKDPRWAIRMYEVDNDIALTYGPSVEFEEGHLLQDLYGLDESDSDDGNVEADKTSLFEQTRRILDHMWCANDPTTINKAQQDDWYAFKMEMRANWSAPLLRTMLLFAAMIVCRIPLSAAGWVNRLFVPVYVTYGEALLTTVGLLAKSARQVESARDRPQRMYSVGQHLPTVATRGLPFGKDHFLVEPARKVPVGILPDFLPDERTDEQYTTATRVLYAGLSQMMDGNKVGIMTAPLFAVSETRPP